MSSKVIPFPAKKAATAKKTHLVRGIDPIPEQYEFLSSYAAIGGLSRSVTTLGRLADEAAATGRKKDAAALRRCQGAAEEALNSITGGFDVRRMESLAAKWNALTKQNPSNTA